MPRHRRLAVAALLLVTATSGGLRAADEPAAKTPAKIGAQVADFSLRDFRGKTHALADFADSKLVVVTFVGCDCPVVKLYAPRLMKLAQEFGPQGVTFLAINANAHDSLSEIAAFAKVHGIEFPVLKDVGSVVADQFAAERTPETFVLDKTRTVRYHGRIDDQYIPGQHRQTVTREDLKLALEDLLADRAVSVAETPTAGCHVGRLPEPQPEAAVTYTEHIAKLIENRCVACHREGEVAPFPLTSYADVAGWSKTIREVIEENRMPPWHADPAYGHFANDPTLSSDERKLLNDWIDAGAPEGDPAKLPAPRKFAVGWQIPEPEMVIFAQDAPFDVPAEGVMPYQNIMVDPGFKEDRWIRYAECRPGNRAVVHHMVVNFIPPGKQPRTGLRGAMVGFAPGLPPVRFPEGMAMFVPAGSKILFQMHYTPNGSPQQDRSSLGLVFADSASVKHPVDGGGAVNVTFEIPPGAEDVEVRSQHRFAKPVQLLSLMPHMHLRGKSFRYEAIYPDGTKEVLLDVPHYDFNWQLRYELAEAKLLPRGTLLSCTAHYDNSSKNPANPDPSKSVHWGEQTWDEMMIGYFSTIAAPESPSDNSAAAGNPAVAAGTDARPAVAAARDDAASRQAAKEVLQQGLAALGGEELLAKRPVVSFKMKGKVFISQSPVPFSGQIAMQPLAKQMRMQAESFAFKITLVLNGDQGWIKTGERANALPAPALSEHRDRMYAESRRVLVPGVAGRRPSPGSDHRRQSRRQGRGRRLGATRRAARRAVVFRSAVAPADQDRVRDQRNGQRPPAGDAVRGLCRLRRHPAAATRARVVGWRRSGGTRNVRLPRHRAARRRDVCRSLNLTARTSFRRRRCPAASGPVAVCGRSGRRATAGWCGATPVRP